MNLCHTYGDVVSPKQLLCLLVADPRSEASFSIIKALVRSECRLSERQQEIFPDHYPLVMRNSLLQKITILNGTNTL